MMLLQKRTLFKNKITCDINFFSSDGIFYGIRAMFIEYRLFRRNLVYVTEKLVSHDPYLKPVVIIKTKNPLGVSVRLNNGEIIKLPYNNTDKEKEVGRKTYMNGKILIIVGGSCIGKTYLEKALVKEGFSNVIIYTNRKRRKDDPPHYRFVSTEQFEDKINTRVLDYHFKSVEGTYYGYKVLLTKGIQVVSFIDKERARTFMTAMRAIYNFTSVNIELTAPKGAMEKCFKERGMSEDLIKKRLSVTDTSDDEFVKVDRELAVDYILKEFDLKVRKE